MRPKPDRKLPDFGLFVDQLVRDIARDSRGSTYAFKFRAIAESAHLAQDERDVAELKRLVSKCRDAAKRLEHRAAVFRQWADTLDAASQRPAKAV